MMKRSIETWEQCIEELKPISEKIAKYEANKIALRQNVLLDLYKQYHELSSKQKEVCPHDQVIVVYGSYTDVGYGCDRYYYHYDLRCERCSSYLTSKTEGRDQQKVYGPVSLEEAVEWYLKKESLSDKELDKLGFRRETKTVTTLKLVNRG